MEVLEQHWAVTGAEMDEKVGGLGVEEDGMECSGGVEKGGCRVVRVKVKTRRKPEAPLQVLSEERSDEGGSDSQCCTERSGV